MSDTIRCQGCGRMLTALRDGTARRHNNRPGGYHCGKCGADEDEREYVIARCKAFGGWERKDA